MPLIRRFVNQIKVLTSPLARYRISPIKEVALKGVQNHFFMVMGEPNGGIQGHQDSVVAREIGKVTFFNLYRCSREAEVKGPIWIASSLWGEKELGGLATGPGRNLIICGGKMKESHHRTPSFLKETSDIAVGIDINLFTGRNFR
jgi:hypothetical protein